MLTAAFEQYGVQLLLAFVFDFFLNVDMFVVVMGSPHLDQTKL